MTLYELTNAMSIQGNIEIEVFTSDGHSKDTYFLRNVDELSIYCYDLEDIENLEVKYIFSYKSLDSQPWLKIELDED